MKNKKIFLRIVLMLISAGSQQVIGMSVARRVAHVGGNCKSFFLATELVGKVASDPRNFCTLAKQNKSRWIPVSTGMPRVAYVSSTSLKRQSEVEKDDSHVKVMAPIEEVVAALLTQKYSPLTALRIGEIVQKFIDNQNAVEQVFKKIVVENMGGTLVKNFAIPVDDMNHIREKLRPFSTNLVFFRALDEDPLPHIQTLQAFHRVGFSMNKPAERIFLQGLKKVDKNVVFDRAQMKVMVDQGCLQLQNGHGDLKVLFQFLVQHKSYFSDEEFYTIMGAFGEDFLASREELVARITKEVKEMGIHDLRQIEDFDIDLVAFERYQETRVGKMILGIGDQHKIEAYKAYYQNRHDSEAMKRKSKLQKETVKMLLQQGRAIPGEILEVQWPTDLERVAACDKALAELKAAGK